MNKPREHYVELLKARKDAAKSLEPAKQSLDFVSALVDRFASPKQ
jgi:hypothetical protein